MTDESRQAGSLQGRRFLVQGRVQGVGFRAATQRRAVALGLRGHARNLADGRVEVVAAGSEESVRTLRQWLARGPAAARVDVVQDAGECRVRADAFTTA